MSENASKICRVLQRVGAVRIMTTTIVFFRNDHEVLRFRLLVLDIEYVSLAFSRAARI